MNRVTEIRKQTDNEYLNIYEFNSVFRDGSTGTYFMASRNMKPEQLKAVNHNHHSDGVIIYSVYGENKDKLVLVAKQGDVSLQIYNRHLLLHHQSAF